MSFGLVESILSAIAVSIVILVRKYSPDKRVIEILGPDPMKPCSVHPTIPMDKALELLILGLTSVRNHGGWRVQLQHTDAVAAEMEYRSTGRASSHHLKLKFHAQFQPNGQQTEISWQYEEELLTLDSTPRPPTTWDGLCYETNAAILKHLGVT